MQSHFDAFNLENVMTKWRIHCYKSNFGTERIELLNPLSQAIK